MINLQLKAIAQQNLVAPEVIKSQGDELPGAQISIRGPIMPHTYTAQSTEMQSNARCCDTGRNACQAKSSGNNNAPSKGSRKRCCVQQIGVESTKPWSIGVLVPQSLDSVRSPGIVNYGTALSPQYCACCGLGLELMLVPEFNAPCDEFLGALCQVLVCSHVRECNSCLAVSCALCPQHTSNPS